MRPPELSIVVSAYNEERNVDALLSRLLAVLDRHRIRGEIVFLNNHSTDGTGKRAQGASRRDGRVRVVQRYNRPHRGLGSSLREGFSLSRGAYVLIMDADLSHDPEDISRLFRHRREADIIVGSRFVRGGRSDMPLTRRVISMSYNRLVGLVTGTRVNDITTGFKLYRKEVIDGLCLVNNEFGLHVELFLKASHAGFRALEIPIHYRARTEGTSKLSYTRQFWRYAQPVAEIIRLRLGL